MPNAFPLFVIGFCAVIIALTIGLCAWQDRREFKARLDKLNSQRDF